MVAAILQHSSWHSVKELCLFALSRVLNVLHSYELNLRSSHCFKNQGTVWTLVLHSTLYFPKQSRHMLIQQFRQQSVDIYGFYVKYNKNQCLAWLISAQKCWKINLSSRSCYENVLFSPRWTNLNGVCHRELTYPSTLILSQASDVCSEAQIVSHPSTW